MTLRVVAPLQTLHMDRAHARNQVRVFAEGLFGAAPARSAHNVEHRRECLVHPYRAHLLANHRRELLSQRRFPGAGKFGALLGRGVARPADARDLSHARLKTCVYIARINGTEAH